MHIRQKIHVVINNPKIVATKTYPILVLIPWCSVCVAFVVLSVNIAVMTILVKIVSVVFWGWVVVLSLLEKTINLYLESNYW